MGHQRRGLQAQGQGRPLHGRDRGRKARGAARRRQGRIPDRKVLKIDSSNGAGGGKSAVLYALKLLSYRGRSEKELAERLKKKGFDPDAVSETIERLKGLGYLDDEALALSLRRRAEEVKLLGAAGARFFLQRMGIPRGTAEEALEDYDEQAPAERLVGKRLKTVKGEPDAVKRRLAGALRRRGFSSETVKKALWALRRDYEQE